MGTISYTVPVAGTDLNSVADAEVSTALTTLKTWANGNIDAVNLSAALAQSGAVNQSGQTVKGVTSIATSQSTSSTSYTTLATPDQVAGITLATNGLIAVWYQATWQSSVGAAGFAAIFVGANQVDGISLSTSTAPSGQFAASSSTGGVNAPLATSGTGLTSGAQSSAYTGNVTTGQIVSSAAGNGGGPCYIFAAAGTYTVSVQFKVSSGSVTAANRTLWVQALSFS